MVIVPHRGQCGYHDAYIVLLCVDISLFVDIVQHNARSGFTASILEPLKISSWEDNMRSYLARRVDMHRNHEIWWIL